LRPKRICIACVSSAAPAEIETNRLQQIGHDLSREHIMPNPTASVAGALAARSTIGGI
jgi:hypothetical protein